MATTAAKRELREHLLAKRAELDPAFRRAAATALVERLLGLADLAEARTLLGYASFGSEIDIDGALLAWIEHGRGVFLPYVEGDALGIARIYDLHADTAPGRFGIREPKSRARRRARPDRLDAVIAPGVGFDRRGGRLGSGRGFYDRLLPTVRDSTVILGVAFDCCVVEQVPTGPHDVDVGAVVTERAVYRSREFSPDPDGS